MSKREDGTGPAFPGGPVQKDANNPVQFGGTAGGPFVDPRVNNPAAAKYAEGAAARRRPVPIPRYTEPTAYGPDLPIPRLDSEVQPGLTMADQARLQRSAAPAMPMLDAALGNVAGEPALPRPGGIVVPPVAATAAPAQGAARPTSAPAYLRNGDLLPASAQQDPGFQQGHGSLFAVNQPHLAEKYGVMRGGQWIAPQRLRASAPAAGSREQASLSPQTLEGLQALNEFQSQRAEAEAGLSADAAESPARAVGPTAPQMNDSEKRELLAGLDDFDLNRVKNALFKDLLNNEEQKNLIESRLKPLDLTDLITRGRVTQRVPIRPGILELEFQSYSGDEDLIIKRLIGEEAESLKPSDRYLLDKYTLMGVTIALRAINSTQLPDYRDGSGAFNEENFWKKYNMVARIEYHLLASAMINWFWFDMRVRQLYKADALGNG